jgi:hypothetical protein
MMNIAQRSASYGNVETLGEGFRLHKLRSGRQLERC